MPPIQGETAMEKAERFRKAANVLREKARYTRVANILKKRPDICQKCEEILISEGILEQDLGQSPRSTQPDDQTPEPKPMLMINDDAAINDPELNDRLANFKMEAFPCGCCYGMESLGLLFYLRFMFLHYFVLCFALSMDFNIFADYKPQKHVMQLTRRNM